MNHLRVLRVFSYMTVQSSERSGYMRYGVSESGALDSSALIEGCYLLGNDVNFGCLEFLSSGGVFEYIGNSTAFIVNGGNFSLLLNGRGVSCGVVHALVSGDIIEIGTVISGYVGYLHIGGGILVDEVLGSRSTNVRAVLGGFCGRLLVSGDELCVNDLCGVARIGFGILAGNNELKTGVEVICEIRVMAGSGVEHYSSSMIEQFYSVRFKKSIMSDRLGSILEYGSDGRGGESRIVADGGLSVISSAVIFGDIQIQGDGCIVVLLSDRQPTGGYPRIASIISVDLAKFVRLGVGVEFKFCEVSYEEARELWLLELDRRANLADYAVRMVGDDSGYLLDCNLVSGVIDGMEDI